jgi:hypothetical protein
MTSPNRARADEQERAHEPERAGLLERPLVDEDRRTDAEGDRVGQRVDLQPERALRLRQTGDAPVEHVEQERENEQDRSPVEIVIAVSPSRQPDAVEAAEDRGQGDHVRQQEQGLAKVEPPARGMGRHSS